MNYSSRFTIYFNTRDILLDKLFGFTGYQLFILLHNLNYKAPTSFFRTLRMSLMLEIIGVLWINIEHIILPNQ